MSIENAAPRRTRGRPKGTRNNDSPAIAKVADMLVANPGMKATTAMQKDCPTIGVTLLRRLQRKWAAEKPAMMAEASNRVLERKRREQAARQDAYGLVRDYGQVAQLLGIGKTFPAMLGYELAMQHGAAALFEQPHLGATLSNPAWMTGLATLSPQPGSALSEMLRVATHASAAHATPAWAGMAALSPPVGSALSEMLQAVSQATHGQALGACGDVASVMKLTGMRRRS